MLIIDSEAEGHNSMVEWGPQTFISERNSSKQEKTRFRLPRLPRQAIRAPAASVCILVKGGSSIIQRCSRC